MSSLSPVLPLLALPLKHRRKSLSAEDSPPPNVSSFYRSSSPFTPSSPVPPTPFLSDYAHIQSSPRLAFDINIREPDEVSDGPSYLCRQYPAAKPQCSLPSFRSSFPGDGEPPCTSDYDMSESSDDVGTFRYSSHRRFSDVGPSIGYLADSDDGEQAFEPDIVDHDRRGTFFSTSAERGRWRSDPIPFINNSRPRNLALSKPVLTRSASDPAPVEDSTGRGLYAAVAVFAGSDHAPSSRPAEGPQQCSSPDVVAHDDYSYPLSPLPSSSVPMSPASPQSFAPMSSSSPAPVSPISIAPVSPMVSDAYLTDENMGLCLSEIETTLHESVTFKLPKISQDSAGTDSSGTPLTDSNHVTSESLLNATVPLSNVLAGSPTVPNSLEAEKGLSPTGSGDSISLKLSQSPVLEPDSILVPAPTISMLFAIPTAELAPVAMPSLSLRDAAPATPSPAAITSPPPPVVPAHSPSASARQSCKTLAPLIIPLTPLLNKDNQSSACDGSIRSAHEMDTDALSLCSSHRASVEPDRDKDREVASETDLKAPVKKRGRKRRGLPRGATDTKTVKQVASGSKGKGDLAADTQGKGKSQDGESTSGACGSAGETERRKEKRKNRIDVGVEGPVKKKSRLFAERSGATQTGESLQSGERSFSGKKDLGRTGRKHDQDGRGSKKTSTSTSDPPPATNRHKQKAEEDVRDVKSAPDRRNPHKDSTSRSTSAEPVPPTQPLISPSSSCPAAPIETSTLHSEIRGMLIESMATSRASSLPVSSLYKAVMQSRPTLKAQRGEKEWLAVFELVLKEGQRSGGLFGKVESSGKDHSDRPLEAQWFYVPERDEDQERATLIRSMMPRPGKRSETKKYKQYYYRPLGKISRWDPEDEM